MGFDAAVMLLTENDELPDQSESSNNLFLPSGTEKNTTSSMQQRNSR